MKIDLDCLAKILNAFQQADTTFIDIYSFPSLGVEYANDHDQSLKEEFVFHIHIMLDNELIGTRQGTAVHMKNIGIYISQNGDSSLTPIPLRLTQKGHDFAYSLSNKEVLATLKAGFKDAPFKVLFEGGQRLLEHYFQKKLDSIIG